MSDKIQEQENEIWFSAADAGTLSRFDKDAAYAAFRKRISGQESRRIRRRTWIAGVSAATVLLALVSLLSFRSGRASIQDRMADIVISVPLGARTSTQLPDGTVVWLNAGSRLSYSQNFGIDERLIELVGEGYFEVARNERLPFSVTTDHLQVRVLGTKFNLRDYPEDADATVSLAEGSVALLVRTAPEEEFRLRPDQRASLDKQTGRLSVENAEAATATQWTDGRLVYDGESLETIVRDLERNYSITITVSDDSLLKLHFYGAFLRQEQSLTEILDALTATSRLAYRQEGRHITLYKPDNNQ